MLAAEGLAALAFLAGCGAPDQSDENGGSPSPAATALASSPATTGATATSESSSMVIAPNEEDQRRADTVFARLNPIVKKGCEYTADQDKAGDVKRQKMTYPDPTGVDAKVILVTTKGTGNTVVQSLFAHEGAKKVKASECLGNISVLGFGSKKARDQFLNGNRSVGKDASSVALASKGKFGENNFTEDEGYEVFTRNPKKNPDLSNTVEQQLRFDNPRNYNPNPSETPMDENGRPLDPQKIADMYRLSEEQAASIEKSATFVEKALG